ncbi:MAG: SagB/ThcOx family dehydrogenase [Armatimonadetes bacterium]|nr:SagB/ThcOx family dehydrogenase [Armatimonadota bacterium]
MREEQGIGRHFQNATKYHRDRMQGHRLRPRQAPPFSRHENPLSVLKLPEPETAGGMGLWEVVARRRSVRDFSPRPLSLPQLSQLLWATQGITATVGPHLLRACASAGALYPDETYVFANRVQGCAPGLWHYQVQDHSLAQLSAGDLGDQLAAACLHQEFCAEAAAVFAWAAVVERAAWKYHDRCYRYLYLDAGHLGGQLQLAACALGLGSVNIGAFFDDEVNQLLGLDGEEETALYLTAVGHPQ